LKSNFKFSKVCFLPMTGASRSIPLLEVLLSFDKQRYFSFSEEVIRIASCSKVALSKLQPEKSSDSRCFECFYARIPISSELKFPAIWEFTKCSLRTYLSPLASFCSATLHWFPMLQLFRAISSRSGSLTREVTNTSKRELVNLLPERSRLRRVLS